MIPILYEKTETAFANNGLGRLVDCIECKVTQELGSGVYECDFQYPVTGANFNEIQLGRIIAVTRDDGGQIEPFDIVSYSRPIDGVVSFHAVHTSYRLTKYITSGTNVTTSNLALYMLRSAEPSPIPFTFFAYQTTTGGEMGMADGVPHNVRELIGGGEGSFCSTYNCEVWWSRFAVGFTDRIGRHRDFTIRYGVNMMDYNEETDGSECYTMAVPYWKNGEDLVVGDLVDSGLSPFNRPTAVALDLTSFFKDQPTKVELEAKALEIMLSGQTNLPKRSIEVDFIRLQDLEDYAGYADLLECNLGDSLSVVFPMYNITGTFRIVKVIWDVLRDRFDTMTLGSLQTTLAEALGVGGGMTNVGGGGGGGGSVVSFTQVLSSGTKIGIITIDGTSTDIYAPAGGGGGDTVTWNQILQTGTKIAELGINGNTTDVYAPAAQAGDRNTFYGTSSTAAATANKDVVCSDWLDNYGDIIAVTFTNANTAQSPQLAVNGGTARPIMLNGSTSGATWGAGETVTFMRRLYGGGTPCFEYLSNGNAYALADDAYDLADAANTLAGTKSTVAWNQVQTTGTKIAEITIDGGSPTDVYAPTGGGGSSYTATAPISISAQNVISHDNAIGTAGNKGGTYSSGVGYYMPYFEYDAKGHITDAYNLGQLIYQNNSTSYTGSNPVVLNIYSWAQALRESTSSGFVMFAGGTTQSQTISADANSVYSLRTNFRVADVQAYDVTTFEPVIVDWKCDKVFSAGGSITVTISIAQAYSHDIRWFPILTYATAGM